MSRSASSGVPELPDNAVTVRAEDSFDVHVVDGWLRATLANDRPLPPGEPPQVRQFKGGASNLTYLLRYPGRDLILRRPPRGTKASSAHDMAREYRLQTLLAPSYPYVPTMAALCTDHAVLGADFYVMERTEGTVMRGTPPAELDLGPARARHLALEAVDRLVDLHAVDVGAAGLDVFSRGDGYVQRQVEGWTRRYRAARTWNSPSFERTMAWLAERRPDDRGMCLIHNDYRLDNMVLAPVTSAQQPLRIAGVLDWELATVGDPLMDLGSSLAYWVQADDDPIFRGRRSQPTHLPGMPTRRAFVEQYLQRTGAAAITPSEWAFYEVFGLFRLAGIVQQIYYRYHHRQTRNPAFRSYWLFCHYLDLRCRRLIRAAGD